MDIRKRLSRNKLYMVLSNIKRHYLGRERHLSYGNKNPDVTYYVIGQDDMSCGLWWIVNKVLMHLAYADEMGYVPVIDYLNYRTQYHNPNELGAINVWEKFFEQPCGITLDDIKECKNIILSDHYPAPSTKYLMGNTDFYTDMDKRKYFTTYFKKYIRLTGNANTYLEILRKKIIPQNSKVLGVLCRGTDYTLKRPKGHPIQPRPEDVMDKAEVVMNEYKCDYIFLATEDADILNFFKHRFDQRLLYVEQKRVGREDMRSVDKVMQANIKINTDRYKMGLDYLCATYILSKCECFIAGRCGGTKGVLLMTKGFEYEFIYDLGIFE